MSPCRRRPATRFKPRKLLTNSDQKEFALPGTSGCARNTPEGRTYCIYLISCREQTENASALAADVTVIADGHPTHRPSASNAARGVYNFFLGNDRCRW